MSGPFGSSQFMYATGAAAEEGQSLRFEDGDSAYLSRTPASAGNRRTYTWSSWVKRGNLTSYQRLFETTASSVSDSLILYNDDTIVFWGSDASTWILQTTAVYRDPSAWYHIVVSVDTTQATSSDRMKIYVNNEVQSLSTATYPGQNTDCLINNTQAHYIGTNSATGQYFDGYLANITFIDGQALTPSSFGEYDNTLWKPKDVSGLTFGTNGFFLDFSDSSAIGDDTSGNANDWTANNLVATDVVLDAPVSGGNFATHNSVLNSTVTLSEGNLKTTQASAAFRTIVATFGVSSGKWYWEVQNTGNDWQFIGIVPDTWANMTLHVGQTADSYGYYSTSFKYNNNTPASYGSTYGAGDIIGVALDMDAGTITFYKNNVSQGQAYSGISGTYLPAESFWTSDSIANFGQDSSFAGTKTPQGNTDDNGQGDFYYAPPSAFLCLKTSSLPTTTITAPDEHFNTLLWTGDGVDDRAITAVGFRPGWVWLKTRSIADNHVLNDAVRGGNRQLFSNTTDQEFTATTLLKTFDSDGFTLGTDSAVNGSGRTFVAWNWLAGNGTVSNTDGSITSTVSANTDAGFSVVSYTASSSASTIGHGLGTAPAMIIQKNRDASSSWGVYHQSVGATKFLSLNSTAAASTSSIPWNDTSPTSDVFSIGTGYTNGNKYIAYCFAEVEGYSKIGSYTGNGSANGTFVHCGFRPAWVLIKSTGSGTYWLIMDNTRDIDNVVTQKLSPTTDAAENDTSTMGTNTQNLVDFFSNGFKLRTNNGNTNTSAQTYIFYAVAEAPFKSANAR